MDELDDLLNNFGTSSDVVLTEKVVEAPPTVAGNRKSVADRMKEKRLSRIPANHSQLMKEQSESSDIDSLLASLGGSNGASTGTNSPTSGLASSNSNRPAPNSGRAQAPAQAPAGDDIDSLLAGLDSGGSTASKPARPSSLGLSSAPKSAPKPADDIDSLLNGLSAPASNPRPADDIDSLLMGLTTPPASQPTSAPTPAAAAPVDDIDSLLMGLTGTKPAPVSTAAPSRASAAPSRAAAPPAAAPAGVSDIDSLLAGLSGGSSAPTNQLARSNPHAQPRPQQNQNNQNNAINDVDSLLSSLNVGGGSAAMGSGLAKTQPRMSVPPPSAQDQIGDLLKSFSSGGAGGAGAVPGGHAASKGTCAACRRPVMNDGTEAGGQLYHLTCWTCGGCGMPLGSTSFYMLENIPHCEKCYQAIFCSRCGHCDRPISGQCIQAVNKKYHVNCFVCTQCLNPLGTQMFFEKDGNPFCETCYHGIFAYRCAGCDQTIRGDAINALGKQFHPQCFVCTTCKRSFNNQPFFEVNGMPFCETHFHQKRGVVCSSCQRPVVGRMVEVAGKIFHPEHFICTFCMNSLAGQSFSEKDGKFYCQPCTGQLFS